MAEQKPLREMSRLQEQQAQGFTNWVIVMRRLQQRDPNYVRRADNQVGFYNANWAAGERMAEAVKQCGIYEFKLKEGGYNNAIVYVGCTCRRRQDDSLRQRVNEYLRNGSHKARLINRVLRRGAEIHVRVKPYVCRGAERALNQLQAGAEQLENALLASYDYAWNERGNGEIRKL